MRALASAPEEPAALSLILGRQRDAEPVALPHGDDADQHRPPAADRVGLGRVAVDPDTDPRTALEAAG